METHTFDSVRIVIKRVNAANPIQKEHFEIESVPLRKASERFKEHLNETHTFGSVRIATEREHKENRIQNVRFEIGSVLFRRETERFF